ncbi:MAG: alanine racemase [Oligoflexales bacterium]|nr:alanine racemase [Oligoflexales bacterium]
MRSWIELDRQALVQNYKAIRQLLGSSLLVPVLKSNAYGHGLAETYKILSSELPTCIAVNDVHEAAQLRELGFGGRTLIVGATFPEELPKMHELHCELVIASLPVLKAWLSSPQKVPAHIKIDTGLSRQGFYTQELKPWLPELYKHKSNVVAICTHFANVEDSTHLEFAELQQTRLAEAKSLFVSSGFSSIQSHASASASAILLESARLDLVRIGISIYGLWASDMTRLSFEHLQEKKQKRQGQVKNNKGPSFALEPVLTWKTRIAQLKTVKEGEYVGYGCTFRASYPMEIAVLPVGYNEGYPRIAGQSSAYVLIDSHRCPIIGRLCMNMMMVDVSGLSKVAVEDEVVLIGRSGDEYLSAAQVAEWAETIHYELVTRLNPSLPRILV